LTVVDRALRRAARGIDLRCHTADPDRQADTAVEHEREAHIACSTRGHCHLAMPITL
jgi:hypothetical protein